MQTSFTEKQLQDKDNKTSETIIRKCVHCGMCNATCPTYQINGEELEGPRGRIYLIKDMLENKKLNGFITLENQAINKNTLGLGNTNERIFLNNLSRKGLL